MDLYSKHLERVQQTLKQKKPALVNLNGVLFIHVNTRPPTARWQCITYGDLATRQCEHFPYSLYLAPKVYHLLNNNLRGKEFANKEYLHQVFIEFTAYVTFYRQFITPMKTHWKKAVDADGDKRYDTFWSITFFLINKKRQTHSGYFVV